MTHEHNLREELIGVIYACSNRPEIVHSIESLIAAAHGLQLEIIIVGDSNSYRLSSIPQKESIQVIQIPYSQPKFKRAELINLGLKASSGEYVLISDADIIWNQESVLKLVHTAIATSALCYIHKVYEIIPEYRKCSSGRLSFQLEYADRNSRSVLIKKDNRRTKWRPGYGLVCSRRKNFDILKGLCEDFDGWGWEDCDLIIRSWLSGIDICVIGKVDHISHKDPHEDMYVRLENRNKNVNKSICTIEGKFPGRIMVSRAVSRILK